MIDRGSFNAADKLCQTKYYLLLRFFISKINIRVISCSDIYLL